MPPHGDMIDFVAAGGGARACVCVCVCVLGRAQGMRENAPISVGGTGSKPYVRHTQTKRAARQARDGLALRGKCTARCVAGLAQQGMLARARDDEG